MSKIKLYQIDAFTDKVFHGNPAAVCVLHEWLEEEKMQQIAAENNLAETAFVVQRGSDYEIRWFTPTVEVNLCGHATLAAGYVLFHFYNYPTNNINFHSRRSGLLAVEREGEKLTLDFPADVYQQAEAPQALLRALGSTPAETYKGKTDYMLLFQSQKEVEELSPDFRLMASVAARGVIVTAPGEEVDFVSRFFAPQSGIDEDPVTGSAHTTLTPFWSQKLSKTTMNARQVSARQGDLKCTHLGDRVMITGKAVAYLTGEIEV